MALKAYKHLTDGEVKIVASGSAEETALLADTVKGGSYLQLTSAGHAQEVAAAQGTALWVDVTSDLGSGGGSSAEVFEVTNLVIPEGTDWSFPNAHVIGTSDFDEPWRGVISAGYLEVAAPIPVGIGIILDTDPQGFGLTLGDGSDDASYVWTWLTQSSASSVGSANSAEITSTLYAAIRTTGGPMPEDITIVRARASFLPI